MWCKRDESAAGKPDATDRNCAGHGRDVSAPGVPQRGDPGATDRGRVE